MAVITSHLTDTFRKKKTFDIYHLNLPVHVLKHKMTASHVALRLSKAS